MGGRYNLRVMEKTKEEERKVIGLKMIVQHGDDETCNLILR